MWTLAVMIWLQTPETPPPYLLPGEYVPSEGEEPPSPSQGEQLTATILGAPRLVTPSPAQQRGSAPDSQEFPGMNRISAGWVQTPWDTEGAMITQSPQQVTPGWGAGAVGAAATLLLIDQVVGLDDGAHAVAPPAAASPEPEPPAEDQSSTK